MWDMFLRLRRRAWKTAFLIYACVMGRSIYVIRCCQKENKDYRNVYSVNGENRPGATASRPGEIVILRMIL